MVEGISPIEKMISRAFSLKPVSCAFLRRKASMSSGGYSFVVRMVHSTALKNAAAPR